MLQHLSLALLMASLAMARTAPPNSVPEEEDGPASPAAPVLDGSEEWTSAISAYDGTDQARHYVEPLLDVVPELRWTLYRDRRASHGPQGVEAPENHQGAEVRYYEYPGPWTAFGEPFSVGEFASKSGNPAPFAFYAKYDDGGRLVRCVEFDGLLGSGVGERAFVEMEERYEWNENRLVRSELSWPYKGASEIREFVWSADGLLRWWVDRKNGRVERSSMFEYAEGFLSGRRVFEADRQITQYFVERDSAHRITEVRRNGHRHWRGGGVSISYRYPEDGGLQRITRNKYGDVKGGYWQRGSDSVELYCSFLFRLRDGKPVLEGSRTRYVEGLKHIESFRVPVDAIPDTKEPIDPKQLLEATAHSTAIRPQGLFWPERQVGNAHSYRDKLVLERDEHGNWLKAGFIDPETGERRVTHARTIEYR